MAEQHAQHFSAPLDMGHGGVGPGGAPPATRKSLPAKMTDSVRKRPGVALAIIVVLAILVLFLYAQHKGLFGLGGGGKSPMRGDRAASRGSTKKARAKADDDDGDDPETEDLIDSINGSGR